MTTPKVSVLFPGQGAFYHRALNESRAVYPQIDAVISEIDVAMRPWHNTSMAEVLFGQEATDVADLFAQMPHLSQIAIYTISLAVYRVLQSYGLQPSVFMGHSFGEIAALVAGGWYSVGQGVELVLHRTAALQALRNTVGYMAALATDRTRAEKILDLAGGEDMAIASENHKGQTVISGPSADMDRCEEVAKILNISFARLKSPYPFHSPMLKAACADFAGRIRHIEGKTGDVPVFSPILNTYYKDKDVLADCLSAHLVLPVNFASAVQQLYQEGVRTFVEAGALNALTKITSLALGKTEIQTVACLDPGIGELESFRNAIDVLTVQGLLNARQVAEPRSLLLPDINPKMFESFWATRHGKILSFVKAEFQKFVKVDALTPNGNKAAPAQSGQQSAERSSILDHSPTSRTELFTKIAAAYAEALEYPQEVFSETVDLEAELGIDSVKQTELLARLSEQYDLPTRNPDFRLSDYNTIGKIVDFVFATLQQIPRIDALPVSASTPEISAAEGVISRAQIFKELAAMYAAALEYPEEVFTETVHLEAELGIDSVKQTELMTRVAERYNFPPLTPDFRLSDYSTLGKVVDLVCALQGELSAK